MIWQDGCLIMRTKAFLFSRLHLSPQDPDASYDVNDRDSDPQPRYTQLNDNRYGWLRFSLPMLQWEYICEGCKAKHIAHNMTAYTVIWHKKCVNRLQFCLACETTKAWTFFSVCDCFIVWENQKAPLLICCHQTFMKNSDGNLTALM